MHHFIYILIIKLCEDQSRAEKYTIQLPTCTRRRLARIFGPYPFKLQQHQRRAREAKYYILR